MGFHVVSAKNHVDQLMERYDKIRASDLEACRQALADPIEVNCLIDVYFQHVKDAIQFAQDSKTLFPTAQTVQMVYHDINNTGL